MPLQDILEESTAFFQQNKTIATARLLSAPPGALTCRKRGHQSYCYLRQYGGKNNRNEIYLGVQDGALAERVKSLIANRARNKELLRTAKDNLKQLGGNAMAQAREDFSPLLKELVQAFSKRGLFDAGFSLIGSWCFHLYQNHLGVEFYPLRTLDIDFCLSLPYTGQPADLPDILRKLGFNESIDYKTGAVVFVGADYTIELLAKRQGSGRNQPTSIPELKLAPIFLPYLDLLIDNPIELDLRGVGKVVVPSMPAFFVHKILVAGLPERKKKRENDLFQASSVCKRLAQLPESGPEVRRIMDEMPKTWIKRFNKSLRLFSELFPAEAELVHGYLSTLHS